MKRVFEFSKSSIPSSDSSSSNLSSNPSTQETKIEKFLEKISSKSFDSSENIFNPYCSGNLTHDRIRINNLRVYLNHMAKANPQILFIAEAPGYRGCRRTGVPFSSESILFDPNHPFFGSISSSFSRIDSSSPAMKENSATIIWELIKEIFLDFEQTNTYTLAPVIWNCFPFHPHKNGNPESNRTPTQQEIQNQRWILDEFVRVLFPNIRLMVCVGRKAEGMLKEMIKADSLEGSDESSINFWKTKNIMNVRHPSHGGKELCRSNLKDVLKKFQDLCKESKGLDTSVIFDSSLQEIEVFKKKRVEHEEHQQEEVEEKPKPNAK